MKINPKSERDLKRLTVQGHQRELTRVYERYSGRPVTEVKPALEEIGFGEPLLSQLASQISEGKEPKVE
ncbi:hypothetical protein ACIA48_16045 [Mycobacterium sp. NPDC051804]|uniref:hypothetical protein n=1 Tax=Mycobacterium sp. NPDC051804 TaxID=3364295 RepID=UPI0037B11E61